MLLPIEYPISYSTLVLFPKILRQKENSYTRMMAARAPKPREGHSFFHEPNGIHVVDSSTTSLSKTPK
jgi:hypothetical protein